MWSPLVFSHHNGMLLSLNFSGKWDISQTDTEEWVSQVSEVHVDTYKTLAFYHLGPRMALFPGWLQGSSFGIESLSPGRSLSQAPSGLRNLLLSAGSAKGSVQTLGLPARRGASALPALWPGRQWAPWDSNSTHYWGSRSRWPVWVASELGCGSSSCRQVGDRYMSTCQVGHVPGCSLTSYPVTCK